MFWWPSSEGSRFSRILNTECWNTHRIRPSGKELYLFPEETGGPNMLQAVIEDDIDEME